MKPAQWTAIVVFALMVGGISFVTVYLGGSARTPDEVSLDAPLPTLNFPIKAVGQGRAIPLVTEVRQYGHQDFWFINESGQDLFGSFSGFEIMPHKPLAPLPIVHVGPVALA